MCILQSSVAGPRPLLVPASTTTSPDCDWVPRLLALPGSGSQAPAVCKTTDAILNGGHSYAGAASKEKKKSAPPRCDHSYSLPEVDSDVEEEVSSTFTLCLGPKSIVQHESEAPVLLPQPCVQPAQSAKTLPPQPAKTSPEENCCLSAEDHQALISTVGTGDVDAIADVVMNVPALRKAALQAAVRNYVESFSKTDSGQGTKK